MLLVPVRLDVLFPRIPWMNYAIIAITTVITLLWWFSFPEDVMEIFILQSLSEPWGWFTCALVHADIFHWFFNMVFLWVFGNAICSKVGNWRYLALYLFFTLCSSLLYLMLSDGRAIGASGAINGVIGFYFALYPVNQIKMFYMFSLPFGYRFGRRSLFQSGTFQLTGYWVILFWLIGDIYGVLSGGGGIAYAGHLGGFIGGMFLAVLFLKFKLVEFQRADNNHLFQRFFGSFIIDDLTKEMKDYCASLGSKEFKVKINDLEEQTVPASLLHRMMQTKNLKGTDFIYDPVEDNWLEVSRYFHNQVEAHKKSGRKIEAYEEPATEVNNADLSQENTANSSQSFSQNIRSWGQESFYIYRDGQNHGPYPAQTLADYLEQQQVFLEDLIFNKTRQEWQPLSQLFAQKKTL